jgi:hypothetical protein
MSMDAVGNSAPYEAMAVGIGMATMAVRRKAASLRPVLKARGRRWPSTHRRNVLRGKTIVGACYEL